MKTEHLHPKGRELWFAGEAHIGPQKWVVKY